MKAIEVCEQCERKNTIKCMDKAEEELPEQAVGFGHHDSYVDGMVQGIRLAIQHVRDEMKQMSREIHEFGLGEDDEVKKKG